MDTETRECLLDWRAAVIEEAMTWKQTPFHHKARKKGIGCDCGGFIYEVFKTATGLPHEGFPTYYAEDWALHKDNNEIYLGFLKPYVTQIRKVDVGDLIMFKMGRAFSHGTIYIGNRQVIHSYGRTGHGSVMISPLAFFNIGMSGKVRERKMFTLDQRWLS